MSKKIISICSILAVSSVYAAEPQSVNVYTYDSFSSEWGAAPQLTKQFEQAQPQCKLNFIPLGDAGTMFNRLRLEGKNNKADLVLGLDNSMIQEAEKTGLFSKHQIDLAQLALPNGWQNPYFLPYDFGEFAFIYNQKKLSTPPKSLKELVERQDLKVIYQDPRTSSVGRGLVQWLNQVYTQEEIEKAWQQLAKHTVTIGKGWSESYGAFLKGESDLVLSYSSSPLYHQLNENNNDYAATQFSEGRLLQIELAAKIAGKNNICADSFLGYLLSPEAQKIISQANVMLPVINAPVEPHYDALRKQQTQTSIFDSSKIDVAQIKQWLKIWQQAVSQ